jgi:hypothetical protein
MSKRCKHENLEVLEHGTAYTSHVRELDGEWTHASDISDYTGKVDVECLQCGMKKTYCRNKPQWLINRMDEFLL